MVQYALEFAFFSECGVRAGHSSPKICVKLDAGVEGNVENSDCPRSILTVEVLPGIYASYLRNGALSRESTVE